MFVELENTVEGLVHIASLQDDYYHYDETTHSLIGEHTAKVYRMGQHVRVKCIGADRFKREVDFEVLVQKSKKKSPLLKQQNRLTKQDRTRNRRRRKRKGERL